MRLETSMLTAKMDHVQIDLYEFLTESELQHYYNSIKNELKITNASQFKYATDEDLKQIGLSRPEIRRLRKFYEKYFPHGYLSKIKRLLQAPTTIVKRDDGSPTLSHSSAHSSDAQSASNPSGSPSKTSNNKHIIPADSICVNKQLGTGEFGIVQQGVWTNGSERIQVAIKCLCRERMQSNPMEFLKEAAIMHSIEHENIVRLYGVVLSTDSLMLVTELAHLRSLLECLKDSGLRVSFLTIPTLCEFAIQICNGMKYLENKRLIHRDLAARNILVFSKNKVKISDFGLSRALGVGKDYYKTNFNVNLKLPIAWCAPECINYLRFTNASDVWAYGVCLWEMFSYGFQPWAALTGLQILEAIDAPNYQRLEQPECCPRDYYQLMMKCWQDDPLKRPKFNEIFEMLPEIKPEQLKAVFNYCEPKKDHLLYRQGDIITVLDRNTNSVFWKGALTSGKTGLFNPANTVAYLESIPSSNRDSFCRTSERCSKRKLRTEMISKPQNDLKHTGHIGIDGDSFGDVAFLANSQNYNHLPRQIVTPYKPSEDIEQTPLLLPPTPTSPDSLQTASSYFAEELPTSSTNPTFISSNENTPKQIGTFGQTSFDFSGQQQQQQKEQAYSSSSAATNPFTGMQSKSQTKNSSFAMQNNNYDLESNSFSNANLVHDVDGAEGGATALMSKRSTTTTSWASSSGSNPEEQHEYHEISDDDIAGDKFDFGPSLLAEINSMFGSMSGNVTSCSNQPKSPDLEHINKKNEHTEYSSKLNRKSSTGESNGNKTGTSKKKGACTVKPISVKDEKILNHAIEIANEISARSMTDLVCEQAPTTQSPKRKFSFRFPHLSHHGSHDKSNGSGYSAGGASPGTSGVSSGVNGNQGASSYSKEKKNFTEELKSIPDLQSLIGEEGREAYNSLIERKPTMIGGGIMSPATGLLSRLDTNEFELTNAKTFPRRSVHLRCEDETKLPTKSEDTVIISHDVSVSIPQQNAPRPMTLPTRGAAGRLYKSEFMLNASKRSHSEVSKTAGNENGIMQENGSNDRGSPCESPSYLTNTFYTFPDQNATSPSEVRSDACRDSNPIPLPSREGKKHIKTNPKRHVRKYPLIIPAYGVQRTLNKVTEVTPFDDDEVKASHQADSSDRTMSHASQGDPNAQNSVNLRRFTHEVVATVRPSTRNSATYENTTSLTIGKSPERTYINLPDMSQNSCSEVISTTDSASLQFESILEDDVNKIDVLQSPDVTDGFYNFSIQKEQFNKVKEVDFDKAKMSSPCENEDVLKNLDIEKNLNIVANSSASPEKNLSARTVTTNPNVTQSESSAIKISLMATISKDASGKTIKHKQSNELAGHALFKKVRESVDQAMSHAGDIAIPVDRSIENNSGNNSGNSSDVSQPISTTQANSKTSYPSSASHLKDSNSVSCEDLLEFSDKKPKGCERGVDSDEVRIMVKVLGTDTTPTRCLHVLEFINWDVHKAIKLIKLQNILLPTDLSLTESVKTLQKFEWDLQRAALKMKSLK